MTAADDGADDHEQHEQPEDHRAADLQDSFHGYALPLLCAFPESLPLRRSADDSGPAVCLGPAVTRTGSGLLRSVRRASDYGIRAALDGTALRGLKVNLPLIDT